MLAAPLGVLETLPAQPLEEFSASLDVVAVEVPVDVLLDGRPVRGLRRENFELYEDGERRELAGFDVVEHAPAVAPEAATGGSAGAAATAPGERRNVLLLLDLLFSTHVDQQRALTGARRFVASSLGPADFAAIALSGVRGGSRLIVPFTTDREWLAAGLDLVGAIHSGKRRDLERARVALARFAPGPGSGERVARLTSELGPALALVAAAPSSYLATAGVEGGPGVDRFAESPASDAGLGRVLHDDPAAIAAELAESAISATAVRQLEGVAALLGVLRDLPGRKLLLFFSRGFDPEMIRRQDSLSRAELVGALERTAAAARRAGWSFHPIDLAGVPGADRPGFDADPLLALATGTGGRLRENFNEFDAAAARVLAETAVSYRLMFQRPPYAADGRLHRLDVRLVGAPAGARVVHRSGNQAPLPEREKSELERRLDRAAEILGDRQVAELDAAVDAFPRPASAGAWRVVVAFHLDDRWRDRLALPGSGFELELAAYAIDGGLEVVDHFSSRVRLDAARHGARLARGGLHAIGELVLPAGDYRLRVVARDPATGRVALLGRSLSLGGAAIWTPLVVAAEGVAIGLDSSRRSAPEPGEPFAVGAPPLVPWRAVHAGSGVELELAAAGVAAAEAHLALRVLDAAGLPVAAPAVGAASPVAASAGLARWRARLDAARLAPGDYRLELALTGADLDGALLRRVPFTVTAPEPPTAASARAD